MRLDRFLSEVNKGTRSKVKEAIRKGLAAVNGQVVTRPDFQVNESADLVTFQGEACIYRRFAYFMLNKPAGVVSATRDRISATVLELLGGVTDRELFPVGRLDKDTEGLLLITNDGELAHRLLAPKNHVDKTYFVRIKKALSREAVHALEAGLDIGDESPTLPARTEYGGGNELLLTIQEGRYHQVKRMLAAVENEVVFLKRVSFGPLALDETLSPGAFRELTAEEVEKLKQC